MKNYSNIGLVLSLTVFLPFLGWAQSDDLYFDPVRDVVYTTPAYEAPSYPSAPSYQETLPPYEEDYDNYSYWDDQGFFYTSRIRRFQQPYGNFGYFDPIYTDMGFYDPWMMPGTSIYVGVGGFNDWHHWRRMNRFRPQFGWGMYGGWNTFGSRMWMDPWTYSSWGAFRVYDPWFDPYWGGMCFNRGFMPGWGFGNTYFINNNFYGGGWGAAPGYWFGQSNGTIDTRPTNQFYGPRVADARTGPARGSGRDTEYVGGGIPRLRDVVGTGPQTHPGDGAQPGAGLRDGNPATRNGARTEPAGQVPVRPGTPEEPTRGRLQTDPVREPGTVSPTPDVRTRDEQPTRGTITPPAPERRDPLGERQRWSDTERQPAQRPSPAEERSRESYRQDYQRQHEMDRRPSAPQADPRRQPQTAPSRQPEQRQAPARRDEQRSTPAPRQRFESPTPSRETPSRGFDQPSRSTPSPGSMDRSSSRGSSPSASPRSGGGSTPRGNSGSSGERGSSRRGG